MSPEEFEAELKAMLFAQFREDTDRRIALLKLALRGEPLTEGREPTAEGHIGSAITKLERAKELARFNKR